MKQVTQSAFSALVVATIVFGVVFARQYSYVVAHQHPHHAGAAMPLDAASVPPSAAWLFVSPWGVLAFAVTFIVVFVTSKVLASSNHAS